MNNTPLTKPQLLDRAEAEVIRLMMLNQDLRIQVRDLTNEMLHLQVDTRNMTLWAHIKVWWAA